MNARQPRALPVPWLRAKERGEKRDKLELAQSLIRNILHSASQGLGIGAVITYVDLMQVNYGSENQMPDPEIFSALVKNTNAARQWLAAFENILKGLQKVYVPESLSAGALQQIILETVEQMESLRRIKNHRQSVQPVQFSGELIANAEAIRDILGELLLNAFKYSPAESHVSVICYETAECICLAVLNDIEQMRGGVTGIPVEHEEKLFEPFYRLNNTWDDRYQEQKLGLGVGLTLAENAAQQFKSRVYVYETERLEAPLAKTLEAGRKIVAELVMRKAKA
ncbi:MAG: ATP-binding protein [Turneriella sp.]